MDIQQKLVQLEKENKLLKEYAKALDGQNQARNEQRRVLEAEIQKLLNLSHKSQKLVNHDEVLLNQSKVQNMRLKEQAQKLRRELELSVFNYAILMQKQDKDRSTAPSSQLISLKNSLREVESKLSLKMKESENTQKEVQSLRRQKLNTNDTIRKLESSVRSLNSQKSSFMTRIQQYTNQITQLKSQLRTNQQLIEELHKKESVPRHQQHQQQILKNKLIQQQREISSVTAQLQSIKSALNSSQHTNQQLSLEISALNQKLFNTQKLYYSLRDSQGTQAQVDTTQKQQINKLEAGIKIYLSKINQLEEQLSQVEGKLLIYQESDIKQNKKGSQCQNCCTLITQNQTLIECIENLQHRIEVLEEVNISLRDQLKSAIASRNEDSQLRSRVSLQKQQQLLDTVQLMKTEIEQLRQRKQTQAKQVIPNKCPKCENIKRRYIDEFNNQNRITFSKSPIVQSPQHDETEEKIGYHYMGDQSESIRFELSEDEKGTNNYSINLSLQQELQRGRYNQTSPNFYYPERDTQIGQGKPKSSINSKSANSDLKTVHYNNRIREVTPKGAASTFTRTINTNTFSSPSTLNNKQQYDELQRKIAFLRKQNDHLKQGLYGQPIY